MMERNIPRELVGERTRTAIRDLMGGTLLREINEMWQDEGFPPAQDPEPVGGQRVTRFQGYLNQVDWTDPGEVHRALRVFEVVLRSLFSQPEALAPTVEVVISRVRRLLEKDGYTLDGEGRITGGPLTVINDQLLSSVSDPAAIHDHLERISRALGGDDPAQVIGSAKELIESTAKIVLTARQKMYKPGDDLPKLVDEAQKALSLYPSQAMSGPDGSEATRKILGAAKTVTAGLAELRNRGYGTGHGTETARTGLATRHARLAVNAARLWCELMLDTLSDPGAPWRQEAKVAVEGRVASVHETESDMSINGRL